MKAGVIEKYLERYAEPEAQAAQRLCHGREGDLATACGRIRLDE